LERRSPSVVARHLTPVALRLALVPFTVNATLNRLAPWGRGTAGLKGVRAKKGKSASVTVRTVTSRLLTMAYKVAENAILGSYAGTQRPKTFLA
jgi:hypothetical protein